MLLPIHVLSRDGQSISGSWDTLTGGCSAHPCTVPGWSEYLGILGYTDRGVQCPSMYCPGMVRVSRDLVGGVCVLLAAFIVYLKNVYICHSSMMCFAGMLYS